MSATRDPPSDLLAFALELTAVADAEILPLFGRCAAQRKSDGTEVTEADRRAEGALRARLAAAFPDHGVLGEELGEIPSRGEERYRWLLDPIDGTASFTLGLPTFGTLIALLRGDEPVLGVIHFPALGESIAAARGLGCHRLRRGGGREPIAVRPVPELRSAVASATGVYATDLAPGSDEPAVRLSAVIHRAAKFRFVGDCLQYALLCRGAIDVAIDQKMNPWDTAALVPCVEEAGGVITDLRGERAGVVFAGSALATSDPRLHQEVLSLLSPLRKG